MKKFLVVSRVELFLIGVPLLAVVLCFSVPRDARADTPARIIRLHGHVRLLGGIRLGGTSVARSAPTVSSVAASNVTGTTATINGSITATGGVKASTCGFAWGTGSALSGGDTATTTDSTCPAATGAFSKSLSSLTFLTTYYFRAYAINSAGTGFGSILKFNTAGGHPGP